jgi:putative oxidoreductase
MLIVMSKFSHPKGNRIMSTRYLPFLGRTLIGLPFVMSGLGKLAAYGPTTEMIGAAGLPLPPLAFVVAVAVEFGCGLFLVLGYRTRLAALALATFSIATALSFHANFADQNQMIHFLKNVMIAGGLLQIAAFGAGPLGIDNRRKTGALTSSAAATA